MLEFKKMTLLLKTVSIYVLEIIQVLKFQPLSKGQECWSPLCFHGSRAQSCQLGSPVVTSASTMDVSSRNYRTMPATDTPEGNSSLVARDEKATPCAPTVTQLASPILQGKSGPDWDALAEPWREVCTMPTPLCLTWATIINHSLSWAVNSSIKFK